MTFNGTASAGGSIYEHENYWKLVGETGTIVSDTTVMLGGGERVLVKFHPLVKALGLECHNEVENALRILKSDLEVLPR